MEFKGSRTEANLMAAFSGESMARNKYDFYAKVARSEGLIQVAEIFEETARNEHYHAKLWYRSLGKLGGTAENLKDAQAGEHYEWTDMYARCEREALDEGFDRMAALFRMVGNILLYRKAQPIRWICTVCGRVHEGTEPPEFCPVCGHPRGHFKPAEKITDV